MTRNYFSLVFSLILWMCCMTSCGFGHPCEKNWEGSYIRYSGDNKIYEHWDISIKGDGTCYAVNSASGFASYTYKYYGNWKALSDDIIVVEMESEPVTSRMTKSKDQVDYEASKAQTRWKRDQVYRESSNLVTHTSRYTRTFFIRKDGATANTLEGLNNPDMICK